MNIAFQVLQLLSNRYCYTCYKSPRCNISTNSKQHFLRARHCFTDTKNYYRTNSNISFKSVPEISRKNIQIQIGPVEKIHKHSLVKLWHGKQIRKRAHLTLHRLLPTLSNCKSVNKFVIN